MPERRTYLIHLFVVNIYIFIYLIYIICTYNSFQDFIHSLPYWIFSEFLFHICCTRKIACTA